MQATELELDLELIIPNEITCKILNIVENFMQKPDILK